MVNNWLSVFTGRLGRSVPGGFRTGAWTNFARSFVAWEWAENEHTGVPDTLSTSPFTYKGLQVPVKSELTPTPVRFP